MLNHTLQLMQESLEQKLQLLEVIENKSKEQAEILKNDTVDMQRIDTNMDEKAVLIEKIEQLDAGFEKTYDRIKVELLSNQSLYRNEIKSIQQFIEKITEKSTSIQAIEARNKNEMEVYFQRQKKELQGKKTSMKAAMGYYENMNKVQVVPPQFMDSRK